MADETPKPPAEEKPVDLEAVKVEDMELTEEQLRTVSGGKGMGRVGRVASFSFFGSQQQEPELERLSPTIAQ